MPHQSSLLQTITSMVCYDAYSGMFPSRNLRHFNTAVRDDSSAVNVAPGFEVLVPLGSARLSRWGIQWHLSLYRSHFSHSASISELTVSPAASFSASASSSLASLSSSVSPASAQHYQLFSSTVKRQSDGVWSCLLVCAAIWPLHSLQELYRCDQSGPVLP